MENHSLAPLRDYHTNIPIEGTDNNYDYYLQYKKLFATSYKLSQQIKSMTKTKEELWDNLVEI